MGLDVALAVLLALGPSDAVLQHATGKRVTLVVEGEPIVGTIASWTGDAVLFVGADGQLQEVPRETIASVTLTPPVAAPSCRTHAGCEEPSRCLEGACRIERTYVDDLEVEGEARLSGGRRTLIAGGVFTTLGVVALPIGIAMDQGRIKGGEGTGTGVWVTATTFLAVGLTTAVFGAIFYGLGKSKLRRVHRYRSRPELIAGTASPASPLDP